MNNIIVKKVDDSELKSLIIEFNTENESILNFGRRSPLKEDKYDDMYGIVNKNNDTIGWIQLELNSYGGYVEIESIYISDTSRGKGYGIEAVSQIIDKYKELGYTIFLAEIKEGNIASEKLFTSLKFTQSGYDYVYRYGKVGDKWNKFHLIIA